MKLLTAAFASLALLVTGASGWAAETDTRVAEAASKQDSAAVRDLIARHAPVNGLLADGSSAMLWAAYYSDVEMVRELLAAGANFKLPNREGITPLIQACRLGNAKIVDLLLKAGADANTATPDGETALMAASGAGSLEAVKSLLARGADPKARESVGDQTALMWASIGGYLPVVQALLKAGADPNAVAEVSPLSTNSSGDAAGRSWVSHATGGLTALIFAARQGQADVAAALLDAGANPNYANPDGLTAMTVATINDRLDLAARLIEKGAKPDASALYEAIQIHNSREIEQNMDATRVKIWHANKTSPLELISLMLEHGADPNQMATHALNMPGSGGQKGIVPPVNASPFARALQTQDVAALKLLLAHGAKPNVTDGGALPLALAMGGGGGGRGGVFGVRPSPLRFASERNADGAVKALLEAGADVNALSATGDTALHAAAQGGNVAMIQFLADHGAKLDVKNRAGFTPLDLAMGKGTPPPGRGGFGGPGRGGAGGPRPEAIVLLRKLQGLPPLADSEMPKAAPGRGGPPDLM